MESEILAAATMIATSVCDAGIVIGKSIFISSLLSAFLFSFFRR